jgi:hypothetical protein
VVKGNAVAHWDQYGIAFAATRERIESVLTLRVYGPLYNYEERKYMEPFSTVLVSALAAGAVAAAKDVASDTVKQAYISLKTLLVNEYKVMALQLLESAPQNEAFQKAVEAEAGQKEGLSTDKEVANATAALQDALLKEPPAVLQAWGIDVHTLKAGRDAIIRNVSGPAGGLKAHTLDASRDVLLENVHGGNLPGKS